jgi:hypothetical protein
MSLSVVTGNALLRRSKYLPGTAWPPRPPATRADHPFTGGIPLKADGTVAGALEVSSGQIDEDQPSPGNSA